MREATNLQQFKFIIDNTDILKDGNYAQRPRCQTEVNALSYIFC